MGRNGNFEETRLPVNYKKKGKGAIIFLSIFFTILVLILIAFAIVWSKVSVIVRDEVAKCSDFVEQISSGKINNLEYTTFMYDINGEQIEILHGNENRIHVSYDELPISVIDAIIAIEDERFFEHQGVDIKRTSGAIFTYLKNKGDSNFGGSTITQQLVKNATDDKETSVNRKIREWYKSSVLEENFSKKEILENYINTIYMGEGAYGIEVASKKYFGKSVKYVNLAESAILAAAIQSPEITNPYRSEISKERLIERQKVVLLKMLELGKITNLEYEEAIEYKVEFKKDTEASKVQSYFIDAVIEQIIADLQSQKGITYEEAKKEVYVSGYQIHTTLDPKIQDVINKTYSDPNLFYNDLDGNFMQSALVVMDHTNGNVLGLIGGADKKDLSLSLNRATQSYRQPGSCMKPIGAYGPAFEQDALNPNSYIEDLPLTVKNWSPKNYYNSFNGVVTVRKAIALSMNLPAVRANMKVDTSFAFNFAKNAGLKSLKPADKDIAPLSLGGLTEGVTPLEMTNAYATIANGGMYNAPKLYTKVLDKDGKEVLFKTYDTNRVMKDTTAHMLTECLQDVVTYGTGYGTIKVGNIPVAGKTGNTDDDKDQWFCGFTPYYTIACWNGYDKPRPIGYRRIGNYPYTAMKLFNTVMNDICSGKEYKNFIGF